MQKKSETCALHLLAALPNNEGDLVGCDASWKKNLGGVDYFSEWLLICISLGLGSGVLVFIFKRQTRQSTYEWIE